MSVEQTRENQHATNLTFEQLMAKRYPKQDRKSMEDYSIYNKAFDLGIGDVVILNNLTTEWTDEGFENDVLYRIVSLEGGRYMPHDQVWDYHYHGFTLMRLSDNAEVKTTMFDDVTVPTTIYFERFYSQYKNQDVITRLEDHVSQGKLAEPSGWLNTTFDPSGEASLVDLLSQLDLSDLTNKEQLTLLNDFTTNALKQVTEKRKETLIATFKA